MGQELKAKGMMDLERAAGYLNELAASMIEGTVVVQKGKDHVVLTPAPSVWVEVEAETGKTKETLSIEISWSSVGVIAETNELVISSEVPTPEPDEQPESDAPYEASEEDEDVVSEPTEEENGPERDL